MKILNAGCPRADGFYMPAEYAPHKGTIIIWPKRPGSWIYGAGRAREAFAEVICAIAESEQAYVLAEADVIDNARSVVEAVRKQKNYQENFPVKYIQMESDDAWARDVGPTFVKNEDGAVRGIDWCFNAWGGKVDGLYADWTKDDRVAALFCNKAGYDMYDAHPFVLEGGAIHTDGEKTVIVTESCLLSKGRNPELSKSEIEQKLKDYLGAEKLSGFLMEYTMMKPTSMSTTYVHLQARGMWCLRGLMTWMTHSIRCPQRTLKYWKMKLMQEAGKLRFTRFTFQRSRCVLQNMSFRASPLRRVRMSARQENA